jgi:hypothetical protein
MAVPLGGGKGNTTDHMLQNRIINMVYAEAHTLYGFCLGLSNSNYIDTPAVTTVIIALEWITLSPQAFHFHHNNLKDHF